MTKKHLAESPRQSGLHCVGADGVLAINANSQEGQYAPPTLLASSWDPSCHQKAVLKTAVMFPFHPSYFLN